MSTATAVTNCPRWCIAPHDEDGTLHYGQSTYVPAVTGDVAVSASWDEKAGRAVVAVGAYEFTDEQAAQLEAAIAQSRMSTALYSR